MKPYTLLFLIFSLVGCIDAAAQTASKAQPIDLPPEAMDKLMGKWAGRIEIPGDFFNTMIFRFEKNDDGKLNAYADCPERGYLGLQLTELGLKGDQVNFTAAGGLTYIGKLSNNSISGIFVIDGKQYTLNMVRGKEFESQIAQVDIPDDVMVQLLGNWNGKLGPLVVIFRFMKNSNGKSVIVCDIPEGFIKDRPILKASLIEGKLILKMAGSEYTGELGGNKIVGTVKFIAQANSIPLTVTKE